jgi:hypothetical protein
MTKNLRFCSADSNETLKELIIRREDLKAILQKENNRKAHYTDDMARSSINKTIEFFKEELENIEEEIKERIKNDPELKEKVKL